MSIEKKIELLGILEALAAVIVFFMALNLDQSTVLKFGLWEFFPALFGASVSTLGISGIIAKTRE